MVTKIVSSWNWPLQHKYASIFYYIWLLFHFCMKLTGLNSEVCVLLSQYDTKIQIIKTFLQLTQLCN